VARRWSIFMRRKSIARQDKAKPDIENIKGLIWAVGRFTNAQKLSCRYSIAE
jgi:hypothetical protein